MSIPEIGGLSALLAVVIVLVLPVLVSRSLLFRKTLPEPATVTEEQDDMKSQRYFFWGLEQSKHDYRLVSGNLHPVVYDDDAVQEVKKHLASKPKLKVRILVGPEIACNKKLGDNAFWRLYESADLGDRFEIRILRDYPSEHYRVMDLTGLYREEYHEPCESKRKIYVTASSFTNAPLYAAAFDEAWSKVDRTRKPKFRLLANLATA